jgi:hypothetical protein
MSRATTRTAGRISVLLIFLNIFSPPFLSLARASSRPFLELIGNTVSVVSPFLMFVLARRAKVLNHVSRYLIYHSLADNRIQAEATARRPGE